MIELPDSSSFVHDETTRLELESTMPQRVADVFRPLREIYFELGLALLAHQRYPDAITALEHALAEPGGEPESAGVLERLAFACEHAGLTERAFRSYLELVQNVPENAAYLLDRAHTVLTPGAALAHGKWATTEWVDAIAHTVRDPAASARAVLVVGRVRLFLAEYTRALERFEEAVRIFPSIAAWANRFLIVESLPPALAAPMDANAHFVLAQLFRILGQYAEARKEVDAALDVGFGGEDYPDAPARQFKAELLELAGERPEAAEWFYEAGRRFSWRGEQNRAIQLLVKAVELKPDRAPVYWCWMDALRMASNQPEPPFFNRERVSEAARAWESGIKVSCPAPEDAWAYLSRALLSMQFAALPGEDRAARWWEAVVLTECSLILREGDPYAWALLAHLYRSLRKNANALEITQYAFAKWPDDVELLHERAAVLANVGEFQAAEEIIDRGRTLEPNTLADAVKAFVLLKTNRWQLALDLLNSAIAREESMPGAGSIGYRQLRADGYLRFGQAELAELDLRWIRERYTPLDKDNQFAFGWAAYKLNELEFASSIFAALRTDRSEAPGVAYRYLGLCDLVRGQLDSGEANLSEGIRLASNDRDLSDLLTIEFVSLERSASGRPNGAELLATTKRLRKLTEAKQAVLQGQRRSPEQELKTAVEELEGDGQTRSFAWVGAQAGLARLAAGRKQWSEAASRYARLLAPEFQFPAARQALRRAADELGRVVFAYFDSSDLASARAASFEALQYYRMTGSDTEAGKLLGHAILSLVPNMARYWDLQDALHGFGDVPATKEEDRFDLALAGKALEIYLANRYGLPQNAGENVKWLPSVNAIVLELEASMVPSGGTEDWPLLKEYLPTMRKRLLGEVGVLVPGIRVRDANLLPGNYLILLDEIPVATGRVQAHMRFCPSPADHLGRLGISANDLMEAPHPITGGPGCWVDRRSWAQVESLKLELWPDPLIYTVRHLEAMLRQNLADFLGLQEGENLLTDWAKTTGVGRLIKAVLPDQTSRLHFVRLLRDLVRENVPIVAGEDLLRSVQNISLRDQSAREAALRSARLAMKRCLPGNGCAAIRFALPDWIESKMTSCIRDDNGRPYLALPRSDSREILRQIRSILRARSGELALVARSAQVRPFMRRLVSTEFPTVAVLSREEVLAPDTILLS